MTDISIYVFLFGLLLLLIGILGGGFELKELKIPKVSTITRTIAFAFGLLFMLWGVGMTPPSTPSPSTPSPSTPIPTATLTGMITKDYLVGSWERQPTHHLFDDWIIDISFDPSGNFETTKYNSSSGKITDTYSGTYQLIDSILTLTSSRNGVEQWILNYTDQDHFEHKYKDPISSYVLGKEVIFTDVYERQLT